MDQIPEVGPKSVEMLLSKLKSVKRVKESSKEVLEKVLGVSKGQIVWEFFNKEI